MMVVVGMSGGGSVYCWWCWVAVENGGGEGVCGHEAFLALTGLIDRRGMHDVYRNLTRSSVITEPYFFSDCSAAARSSGL